MNEDICYVCNQVSDNCNKNLTQLKTNHSGRQISEFIKNLLNGQVSHRNVDDESNCICEGCLEEAFSIDWMVMQVKQQEDQLREVLLSTETTFIKAKIEPPHDICHKATVFVNEFNGDNNEVRVKIEPDETIRDGYLAAKNDVPQTNLIKTTHTVQNTIKPPKQLPESIAKTKYREIFVKKDGKVVRVRLVKTNADSSTLNLFKSKAQVVSMKQFQQMIVTSPTQAISKSNMQQTVIGGHSAIKSTPIQISNTKSQPSIGAKALLPSPTSSFTA